MADSADPVQPDQGQGDEANGGGTPYDELLSRIPEEVRGQVEPVLRDWDANTTRRFQELAEKGRGWEPYEKLGVNQRDPEVLEWAMQFVDTLQNPAAIKEWYGNYARENGITVAQAEQEINEYVDPSVTELVQQQTGPLAQQLAELAQWRDAQERQAAEDQAMSQIRSEIDSLKSQHGDAFNEQAVEKLLPQYIESDPQNAVKLAFADWQAIQSQVQKDWTAEKASQPAGAVTGSGSGTPDPPPKGEALKYAAQQALEQLRAGRQA
jgi:hypothetical protein